jgi:Ca2+-binding EF-hand superfamily protein
MEFFAESYGQELPSRFAKDVTKAADTDGDGFLSVEEIKKLLINIGAKDKLTPEEISAAMEEIGEMEGSKGVPIKDVVDYVKKSARPGVS